MERIIKEMMMTDVIVGRILVLAVGFALAIWVMRGMCWTNKFDKFVLRASFVLLVVRGIGDIVFAWIGLFPFD